MFKKLTVFISSAILLVNIYGCVALIAGGIAGGAGAAVWLSGKLTQNVNASLDQVIKAAKDSLQSRNLGLVTKETATGEGTVQIRSKDIDGEKIWIDIHRITATRSRLEVRVGTLKSNREAADRILKGITERL